jgi:predicted PurR-regulated permease PerM
VTVPEESSRPRLRFSERQQATLATALTILAAVVIVAAVGALVWLLAAFLQRFSNVFLPLAVGALAALVFNPYHEWLVRRLRLHPVAAVAVVFLSILVPVVAFFWFFGALVVEQVSELIDRLPAWWTGGRAFVEERWPQVVAFFEENPWGQRLRAAFEGQGESMMQGLAAAGGGALSFGGAVARWIGSLLGWAVLPVYFGFFLIADPKVFENPERHLPFLKPETRRDLIYLVRQFVDILVAFFRGQLIVAFLQGVLFAIGFSAVGLRYGFVLGLVLGFLNIIPYLGSIIGLAICLPLAFFQEGGGLLKVALVLLVFTLVQMIEGYLLTPKIMGDRTGLHPVAIILAVFFWGSALGGIAGMILAIPLTAFLVTFWRLIREKYIRAIV